MEFANASRQLLEQLYQRLPQLELCHDQIYRAAGMMVDTASHGGTILACGNGGSAADADHLVGELMNRYLLRRPIPEEQARRLQSSAGERGAALSENLQRAIRAISLVSQSALMTAVANDTQPEMIFAQQVYGYARQGDLLVAFSTSGNSTNVINAAHVARALSVPVLALTGAEGGELGAVADLTIRVPQKSAYLVQELHQPVYHALRGVVENERFGT